ncbi:MAG: hypothetical protein ABJC89_25620 [Acidobacteriota bacterium]
MTAESQAPGAVLTRALCILVLVIMFAAIFYGAWIGVSNFSRIHV